MSIANFLQPSYYFATNLEPAFAGFEVALIVFILIILASTILSIKAGKFVYFKKAIAIRLTRAGFIVGWVGLVWLFFRYEGIPYFSWRFWPALAFLYLLVELFYLMKFVRVDYPKKQINKDKGKDKDMYLRRFLGR